MKNFWISLIFLGLALISYSQSSTNENRFKQLGQELPTPNVYRTASGAPGHLYWQQKADYKMNITLDDEKQRISGDEEITYHNNSPDVLEYLWVQLDQNMRSPESNTYKISNSAISDGMPLWEYNRLFHTFKGGFNLEYVKDAYGKEMDATVNQTMMRIDLAKPLKPGEKTKIKIKWWYNINDRMDGKTNNFWAVVSLLCPLVIMM